MNTVRRIVPNLRRDDAGETEELLTQVLGLSKAMDLGWIATFAASTGSATQISLLGSDLSGLHPDISVEVTDVDLAYALVIQGAYPIVYPLTEEPWGVRRFFVQTSSGVIFNVVGHKQ